MRVLQQEQDRLPPGETLELIDQCRERPAALLRGAERQRRIALAERDRQQRGKKWRYGLHPRCAHSEDRFQLVEALLGRVVCPESRRSFQLGDERTKRAAGVVGRALVTQARVRLADDAFGGAAARRDLPIPGSPEISTICPSPFQARRWRSSRKSSSPSRPIRSVRPAARTASKRFSEADRPSTAHAATGSAIPLTSCRPRSRRRNRSPSSRRVEAATTTVPGSAKA